MLFRSARGPESGKLLGPHTNRDHVQESMRVRRDIPFSTIFFKTVMEQCKVNVGKKVEQTYRHLAALDSIKQQAQVQHDAAIAQAAALPLEAAFKTRDKHLARQRNRGQEPGGDANHEMGNAGAPDEADNAGASPLSASKRNREATDAMENPQRAAKAQRGGHSISAVAPGRSHEAPSATRGSITTAKQNRRGGLHVSVKTRGRGRSSTLNHPPNGFIQARGRGRGGGRGGAMHWHARNPGRNNQRRGGN